MFSSKGPLDTPFHHLLLLETNEHKFVPDPLIMCTTERITSVVYDFNVYNRPVGCMLRIAEIKVTAFTHIHTLTSNTKSYKLCYIILLF